MKKHFMVMLVWGLSGVLLFSSSVLSREKGINRLKQNNRENRLALVIGNADYKEVPVLKRLALCLSGRQLVSLRRKLSFGQAV